MSPSIHLSTVKKASCLRWLRLAAKLETSPETEIFFLEHNTNDITSEDFEANFEILFISYLSETCS